MDALHAYHFDAVVGGVLLLYIVNEKRITLGERKRAVRVTATVVKVYSHMHATSYYFRYVREGRERTAKHNGAPLRRAFTPGDAVDILVDPADTTDVPIPETHPNDPAALMGEGNCEPAGSALVTLWDVLFGFAGVFLIYSSFR